jgi:tetratricopeptide (TPR) repeat protein
MPRGQQKASSALMEMNSLKVPDARNPKGAVRAEIDDLADKYTNMADDAASAAKKREAAMLFSVAEGHLSDSGNVDEALRGAKESLALFTTAGDSTGIADSTRLLVNAYKAQAVAASWEADGESKAAEALKSGEDAARDQLAKLAAQDKGYQDAGEKRGGGAMMLAVAEVLYMTSPTDPLSGDYQKRGEALDMASQAKEIFAEVGDEKMEALSLATLFKIAVDKLEAEKALTIATDAVKLYQKLEDPKGEAKALCDLAQAKYMCAMIPEAVKDLKKAVKTFKESGPKKNLGCALLMMAQLCLQTDRAKEALSAAKEALEIFTGTTLKGYLPAALASLARAYSSCGEVPKALAVAKEGVTTCQTASDKKGELLVKVALIDAHVAGDLFSDEGVEEALVVADEAVTLAREVGDKVWEAYMLNNKAMLHSKTDDFASATEVLGEAEALLTDLGNESEQAKILDTVALMHLANSNHAESATAREKERELYQKTGETIKEAMTALQTCVTWCAAPLSADNLSKATVAAKDAQSLCQDAEYKTGEAITLGCLAELHLAGETEKDISANQALAAAKQAEELFEEVGNKPSQAILLRTIANAYLGMKNTEEAINSANKAVDICKKCEDRKLLAEAQILLAQTLLDAAAISSGSAKDPIKVMKKSGSKAMKAAKDSLSIARKLGDRALIASATYTQALVNTSMNNTDEALKGANQAIELFKDLKSKEGEVGALALVAEAHYANSNNDKALDIAQKVILLAQKYKDAVAENRGAELVNLIQGVPQFGAMEWYDGGMGMDMMAASGGGGEEVAEKKGLDAEYVKGVVSQTTMGALATDEEIHLDSPLMESGMDSLSSVAFRNSLNQQLSMNLPAALMFDYPSQRAIIDHVVESSKS